MQPSRLFGPAHPFLRLLARRRAADATHPSPRPPQPYPPRPSHRHPSRRRPDVDLIPRVRVRPARAARTVPGLDHNARAYVVPAAVVFDRRAIGRQANLEALAARRRVSWDKAAARLVCDDDNDAIRGEAPNEEGLEEAGDSRLDIRMLLQCVFTTSLHTCGQLTRAQAPFLLRRSSLLVLRALPFLGPAGLLLLRSRSPSVFSDSSSTSTSACASPI
jgi:hypothetical protein